MRDAKTLSAKRSGSLDILDWIEQAADIGDAKVVALPDARYPALARVRGLDPADGVPLVEIPGRCGAARARSAMPVGAADTGREAVVVAEGGDWGKPILLSVLRDPLPEPGPSRELTDYLHLEANQGITIRCGRASLEMTRAGKIVIQGEDVTS